MIEKETLKPIFKNLIEIILEYQKFNLKMVSENTELISTNNNNLSKHILDLNAQLSNYQLRPDYDQDPEYVKN
ncbi:hypothetical protein LCGC14_1197100 [marine sediment metagenome]|uniref:Uncharacterized protein n=1 Tax=marine sediment metagenome TaxID=412755 RepID=A0A0F9LME4_9ZZZZ|nr:hypothetical protein [archaeon]HEC37640.1 hypothetical protein [bacterium]